MRVGTDIVEIQRFEELSEHERNTLFHPSEQTDLRPEHLAGVFAVKEACRKVDDTLGWLDVRVSYEANGRPYVIGLDQSDVSVSHDGGYAIAVVIQADPEAL